MTQDSSSNKSESSQLTAEGWCRSKLVIECDFDFESCNIMGNRARVFLNKQSERIHFAENTSQSVFHLRTTVPWLLPDSETPALYLARPERFLDNIRKGNFCREPTWALGATGSQKWPTNVESRDCFNGNTLRATSLHLGVNHVSKGDRSRSSHLFTYKQNILTTHIL